MTTKPTPGSTALTTIAPQTPAVITTPAAWANALRDWQAAGCHVLSPFTQFSGIAQSYGLVVSVVLINPDKAAGEVYDNAGGKLAYLKHNERALAKIGLRKIAEGAGISTDQTTRTDDRRTPNFWEFKGIAEYRGVDGSPIRRSATKEWDLRDGSAQLRGWTAAQVLEARKHGARNCEARAINAAIRESGCGIKQAYTVDELARPFVVVRVAFQPDMSDPAIKAMVTTANLSATAALYPGARHHEAPPPILIDSDPHPDPEPRRVGASAATPAATTTTPAAADPPSDEPPTEDAVRIADVRELKSGTNKRGAWSLWLFVDTNGREYRTMAPDYADVVEAAKKAKASGAWVELASETTGDYTNVVEIQPAGRSPKLPMGEDL